MKQPIVPALLYKGYCQTAIMRDNLNHGSYVDFIHEIFSRSANQIY